MAEIWKDILWYEWLYQVSDFGNVRSLNYGKNKWVIKNLSPWRLTLWYWQVLLYKNHKRINAKVHRLVWQAFLGLNINDSNIFVCHKNEKLVNWFLNNSLNNLWLWTWKENMIDCSKKWRVTNQWKTWEKNHLSKKVKQYTLEGVLIKTWHSLADIKRELWFEQATISKVCLWRQKTSYWFTWCY